jgi:hypothetical protein
LEVILKVKQLTVSNIGPIKKEVVVFEKPLNLFFGQIRTGKTTLAINSIKLLFGGKFSEDLLRHGENSGYVELILDRASISRSFYRDGNGKVQARPIEFYKENKKVNKPVDAIKSLVNPFLLDQDFLTNKSTLERQRYFVEFFDIDTTEIDDKIKQSVENTKQLKLDVEKFGEIDTTPVKEPKLDELKAYKEGIDHENREAKDRYNKIVWDEADRVQKENFKITKHNIQIENLQRRLDVTNVLLGNAETWLADPDNAEKETIEPQEFVEPNYKPTAEIEDQISNAKVDELKYNQYKERVLLQEEKDHHISLYELEKQKTKALRQDKIALLKSIDTGIEKLWISDEGEIVYDNTALDMLSTSQLMELKSDCMALYPNELGLELIDKAESLGTSIFEYIAKAKKNESTILATIVSSEPAKNVPEDVGVFIVDGGSIIERR